jgi:DNA modification methylase
VFYKTLPTYNPQMSKCEPHERNHSRGNLSKKPTNRCYGDFKGAQSLITDEKYPTSIITVPKKHKNGEWYHPTEKPVPLLEYLIRTYSNEKDTVLDATMGSGSTMVACVNTLRGGIGIELEEQYFSIAQKRVNEAIRDKAEKLF